MDRVRRATVKRWPSTQQRPGPLVIDIQQRALASQTTVRATFGQATVPQSAPHRFGSISEQSGQIRADTASTVYKAIMQGSASLYFVLNCNLLHSMGK